MKIALLTDTHYGARGDHLAFDKQFDKFYTETFFPTLVERSIKNVIHLGDMFDRRKYINYLTLRNCRKYFFDPMLKLGIKLDVIVGNHDVFYKNTNDINSPGLLLQQYSNLSAYDRPVELTYDGLDILMLPWICADNYEDSMTMIKDTSATVCFGHLELAGFQMHRGQVNDHGFSPSIFNRFDLVCTGHFHHRSSNGPIHYLGNPYELTWADYEDPRGFHIFDTETRELEFIVNPNRMFYKIFFNDQYQTEAYEYMYLKDCFVKVIVQTKENQVNFDMLIDRLEKVGPADLQVVDDHLNMDLEDNDDILESAEDTLTLLSKFCEQIDTKADKKKLDLLLRELYSEAINLESA
jgi:DNA repair exonuclease SbcCD nuclease subunit